LVGTADFGRAFYFYQEVVAAARAGAQFGSESTANAGDKRRRYLRHQGCGSCQCHQHSGLQYQQRDRQLVHLQCAGRTDLMRDQLL
jgi:hypothetical protein